MTDMSSTANWQGYQKQFKMIRIVGIAKKRQILFTTAATEEYYCLSNFHGYVSSIILVVDMKYSGADRSKKGFWLLKMWPVNPNSDALSRT